jgi:hypothetical protein
VTKDDVKEEELPEIETIETYCNPGFQRRIAYCNVLVAAVLV